MSRDWQLSLAGAIIFHLALLYGIPVRTSQPVRRVSHPALEVRLVAAPAPVVAKPVVRSEPRAVPPLPKPSVIPEIEPRQAPPAEKIAVPAALPAKAVAAPIPPPAIMMATTEVASPAPQAIITTETNEPESRATPEYLTNPELDYPLTARRRHQEGSVVVSVVVSAQGKVVRVALKNSSGFSILDDAALKAVRGWEFKPARKGAVAVESQIEVPVQFKLTD